MRFVNHDQAFIGMAHDDDDVCHESRCWNWIGYFYEHQVNDRMRLISRSTENIITQTAMEWTISESSSTKNALVKNSRE